MDALCQQGDPQYKRFHLGLVPGLAPDAFLGVRMPVLRKEARRILKEAPDDFLKAAFAAVDPPYEIRMLQGLVIAQLPCSLPQRLQLCRVRQFLRGHDLRQKGTGVRACFFAAPSSL